MYLFSFRIMELEFLLRIYHACSTKASLEKTDAVIPSQPGLGLYLSQKLCQKMNIVLSISSDPGQGTTVTMVFPTESYLKEAGL